MLWSAAYGLHTVHSAGWETADPQDQSVLQVALVAQLQVQVDPLWEFQDPVALEHSPAPVVAVEPGPSLAAVVVESFDAAEEQQSWAALVAAVAAVVAADHQGDHHLTARPAAGRSPAWVAMQVDSHNKYLSKRSRAFLSREI